MSSNKSSLHEVANNATALKTARGEPIQQEASRQSMDFIRSLVLDLPVQTIRENPIQEGMNIESILETQLEIEARKSQMQTDPQDHVSFDVPTLIRVFELVREGIKSDVELHDLVERLVALRTKGVLTMDDYPEIAGGNVNGTRKEQEPQAIAVDQQDESLDSIIKLAGIK